MYCPTCGSNQDASKRFCTACGTNLHAVNQALTNSLPPPMPMYPPAYELTRQRESAKALRLTLFGGGLIAYKFFSFVFSGGSFWGFLTFLGFILLVSGITKMASLRTPAPYPIAPPAQPPAQPVPYPIAPGQQPVLAPPPVPLAQPRPVFSAMTPEPLETPSRNTNELQPVATPAVSVTEEETRHLPR